MDEINKIIREIKECKIQEPEKVSNLIGKLQVDRDSSPESMSLDLILFGLATGLEKIADYRIFELQNDDRLNELNTKIKKIQEKEEMNDIECVVPGDSDSPDDYQGLNIEFDRRLDEILRDIMIEFGEKELGDLFWDDRKEYIKKYYNGWKVLEKDNPDKLKEIDEMEEEDLE